MSRTFTSICKRLGIFTSATDVPFELLCDSEEKYTCLKIYLTDQRMCTSDILKNMNMKKVMKNM